MQKRGVYYGETTYSQRKYLFELVEQPGNVSEACRHAKVSRGTYYNWYERYEDDGIVGLSELIDNRVCLFCSLPREGYLTLRYLLDCLKKTHRTEVNKYGKLLRIKKDSCAE